MRPRKDWIDRCPECGFLRSTLPAGAGAPIEGVEALRERNFQIILDEVERRRPVAGSRILEVGCSTGNFLVQARARGAEVHAIEPDAVAVETATGLGFEIEEGSFPDDLRDRGPFDLVVFNDVFEHLPVPERALRAAEELLAPAGLLVLNLPSSDGVLYRIADVADRIGFSFPLERLWQHGLSSPHLSYFNPQNLRGFVTRHTDLEILRQRPLETLARRGLRERIRSTVGGPAGWMIFAILFVSAEVIRWLPPDIQLLIARRRG